MKNRQNCVTSIKPKREVWDVWISLLWQGEQGPPGNNGDKGERGDDVSMDGHDSASEA